MPTYTVALPHSPPLGRACASLAWSAHRSWGRRYCSGAAPGTPCTAWTGSRTGACRSCSMKGNTSCNSYKRPLRWRSQTVTHWIRWQLGIKNYNVVGCRQVYIKTRMIRPRKIHVDSANRMLVPVKSFLERLLFILKYRLPSRLVKPNLPIGKFL